MGISNCRDSLELSRGVYDWPTYMFLCLTSTWYDEHGLTHDFQLDSINHQTLKHCCPIRLFDLLAANPLCWWFIQFWRNSSSLFMAKFFFRMLEYPFLDGCLLFWCVNHAPNLFLLIESASFPVKVQSLLKSIWMWVKMEDLGDHRC